MIAKISLCLLISFELLSSPSKTKEESPKKPESKTFQKPTSSLSKSEVESLQKKMFQYPAVNITFKEEIYRKARDKTIKKNGETFISGKSFRWKVGKESWIYDGKKLLQYDETQKYAIRYSKMDKKQELDELVEMITDLKALLKKYEMEEAHRDKDLVVLKLKNRKKSEIDFLEITLEERKSTIETRVKTKTGFKIQKEESVQVHMKKLVLHFVGGNRTSFIFDEFQSQAPDLKKFDLPKGVLIKVF